MRRGRAASRSIIKPVGHSMNSMLRTRAKAIVTAAGWHHVWLYHATTADPLGQIAHRGCSGHYVGAPEQPDCAHNGVIAYVTSYVAKFEFSVTTPRFKLGGETAETNDHGGYSWWNLA